MLVMAEAKRVDTCMAEKKRVDSVPAKQFLAPLLKRPVQEPTIKKVTKKRKECQEVKICKADEVAPADSKMTYDSSSFQVEKEPFEEHGKKRKENWQEIKVKKAAQIAAVDYMAKCISQMQKSDACTGCAEPRNWLKIV